MTHEKESIDSAKKRLDKYIKKNSKELNELMKKAKEDPDSEPTGVMSGPTNEFDLIRNSKSDD